ncbi:MAG: hypothetical protein RL120_18940, partial [Gammaproteobacteria bacterium]
GSQMTLEDLGNLGELIAAIDNVGTLIYLALQIRQNNAAVRISAGQAITETLNAGMLLAASTPQTARVLIYGQVTFEELAPDEKAQFIAWVFAWFRALEQGHYFNDRGLLDDQLWQGQVAHIAQVLSRPPIAKWWDSRRALFNPDFQRFVDKMAGLGTKDVSPVDVIDNMNTGSALGR